MTNYRLYTDGNVSDELHSRLVAFLHDIHVASKLHGFSIAHEDNQGAFIIEPYSEANIEWLKSSYYRAVSE